MQLKKDQVCSLCGGEVNLLEERCLRCGKKQPPLTKRTDYSWMKVIKPAVFVIISISIALMMLTVIISWLHI